MAEPALMKAWQWLAPGPLGAQLRLTNQAPRPTAASLRRGQILVDVASASINPADHKVPALGLLARAILPFPKTVGMDMAGRVAAVAEGVADVAPGDAVVVRFHPVHKAAGALSECVVAAGAEYAPLDAAADPDAAAGLGTAGLTAYQSIRPHVKAGDRVFINGGSGGTGCYGIQVAKLLGCHVTVTCSPAKAALCRDLGADDVIDYTAGDVVAALGSREPFDLAVDNVGTSPANLYASASAFLTPTAKFVWVGDKGVRQLAEALFRPAWLGGTRNKAVLYLTSNNRADLEQLAQWLAQGSLRTVVDSTYEFADAVAAFEALAKGSVAGKIIVRVAPRS